MLKESKKKTRKKKKEKQFHRRWIILRSDLKAPGGWQRRADHARDPSYSVLISGECVRALSVSLSFPLLDRLNIAAPADAAAAAALRATH